MTSLGYVAEPEKWVPPMRYVNFEFADEAGFGADGKHFTTFAHDWRAEPWDTWWDQLADRSIDLEGAALELGITTCSTSRIDPSRAYPRDRTAGAAPGPLRVLEFTGDANLPHANRHGREHSPRTGQ
jgi:hypothetical protein